MIMASHQTFPAKPNLAGHIYHTLSMEKSLSLPRKMDVQAIFILYHKHLCAYVFMRTCVRVSKQYISCIYEHILYT